MPAVTTHLTNKQRWFCAQIGAREHYAVARALHQGRRLACLYTDFWAGPNLRRLAGGTRIGIVRSLATRYHSELADAPLRSWNLRALGWEMILRGKQKAGGGGQKSKVSGSSFAGGGLYYGFIEVGHRFAVRVREALKQRADFDRDSIFFAYDTGALEALEWCRERGVRCVLNQMDPGRVEALLVQAEAKLWPGWQTQTIEVPDAYFRRRESEWALADRVLVNSEFCRAALVKQGVPAEKLVVVPLCYEVKAEGKKEKTEIGNEFKFLTASPLRVLFLGQVILRKGIQHLMAAARLLEKENIHFDVVGPVGISKEAVAMAPRNLTFHGRATRDQTAGWYQRAQLFVLPTLSDGFALTQLEAMSHGLPVIATPCCGAVVSDGIDGFIVPPRDAEALAKSLQRYLVEPELLKAQRSAALIKAGQFTVQRLAENLGALEQSLFS